MSWCSLCGLYKQSNLNDTNSPCEIANAGPCSACAELAEMEKKIVIAKQSVIAMQTKQQELRSKVNEKHDRMIHRLPLELSSEIFQLCLLPDILEAVPYRTKKLVLSAPLILSAVCRKWRDIAHSTPRLWSSAAIFVLVEQRIRFLPELVREWLQRAGQLPLSLNIFIETTSHLNARAFETAIEVINLHTHRLKRFRYQGAAFLLMQLSSGPQGAPDLQVLRLHPYLSRGSTKRVQFKGGKPAPTELDISELRLRQVDIGWNNLTHVHASALHTDECLELIRRAPKMTHCSLTEITPGSDRFPKPDGRPVLHSTLESFEFDSLLENNIAAIHDNLTLPSLKRYTFRGENYFDLPVESLLSFLHRSACSLERLCVYPILIQDPQRCLDLMRQGTRLRHLSLRLANDCPPKILPILSDLIFSNKNFEAGPQSPLTTLKVVEMYSPTNGSLEVLAKLSALQLSAERPHLRSIRLGNSKEQPALQYIDEETVRRILPLVQSGIAISFHDLINQRDILQESIAEYGLGV